jgi:hypothetical protein
MELTIKVETLTHEQAKEMFKDILNRVDKGLDEMDPDHLQDFLGEFVDFMDTLSCDDFFGTEGWKHYYGSED